MIKIKEQFPIFENQKGLVYLDSASTTQKPQVVIDRISKLYNSENANIHRGLYKLSENTTKEYEKARELIAKFINANQKEIIFTRGTTESINFLAYTIDSLIWDSREKGKNEIVLTELEHHSNIVPWQQLEKAFGYKIKVIPIKKDLTLDYKEAKKLINKNTAIVSLTLVSNALGTINNVKEIINLAKKNKAITIVDAAQAISHLKLNVKTLNCDFLAFSGHKIFAPFGIGVLYGKSELLEKMRPFNFGGDMVKSVSFQETTFQDTPERFEAGTQNIEGVLALGEAINFVNNIGFQDIQKHEKELRDYTYKKLKGINGIILYRPKNSIGIISFNLKGIHSHDVAQILSDNNICIRAGHHCCMPLMSKLNISGTCRVSLSIYNTKEDIDQLIIALRKTQEVFKK